MKQVMLLLLLAGLGLSGAVKAQVLAPKTSMPAQPADLASTLENSANPRFKVLNKPTPIYRRAADTLDEKHVFVLTPGTKVYIRKYLLQGYMINFNSEEYYLPYKFVVGIPTQIEI
ncbi:MAG: hypothetical protein EOO57_05500 [Hymenobacter sp.]|nr:MAG: hypothetical protein EOO57_05500 [Hymenobacter sp.]